jgi:hypothetical protein
MAMVLALAVGEVDLHVVIIDECAMRFLDLIPTCCLIYAMISNTPHDPNYVELPLVALKKIRGIERQVHIMQVM